jgi:hypothetical protein
LNLQVTVINNYQNWRDNIFNHTREIRDRHVTTDLNVYYIHYAYEGGARGGAVVEALRYKPEGRGIDSRWCHWNFLLT